MILKTVFYASLPKPVDSGSRILGKMAGFFRNLPFANHNKSLFSTLQIDNAANPKDTAVSTRGNTALSAMVKSPTNKTHAYNDKGFQNQLDIKGYTADVKINHK